MAGRRVLNVCEDLIDADRLAATISNKYDEWKNSRRKWEDTAAEVNKYIFATDTTTTPNAQLPWKNKTTRPKLCQIRDNLHANYMAALFPTEDWFDWRPADVNSTDREKAQAIKAYMKQKIRDSAFEETVSRFVLDYIDYGNVVGDAEYATETFKGPDGTPVNGYIGPRAVRISPYDIVFDITSPSFEQAPKITRALLSLGDIHKLMRIDPNWQRVSPAQIAEIEDNRRQVIGYQSSDVKKYEGLVAAGFSSLHQYYSSGLVEVLEFEGDIYDLDKGTFYENHIITVIDRAYIIRKEPLNTWTGRSTKRHVGWRLRPDNLMAMGPLDNLVGMQYRIDHLENLKADVFDLIAYPQWKIKGYVEDFQVGPNERIYMEESADVEQLRPDTTALNADMQIRELEDQMEEMAGAPRQAVGQRTPGEKTKFEVQVLENGAARVFANKINYFERNFIEPLLNSMLELARRNITAAETVQTIDNDIGVIKFLEVTKADLEAKGKLVPMGARHFAAQAQLVQNLTTLSATPLFQSPSVSVHFSGLRIAKLLEDNMGLTQYRVVEPNIGVIEMAETQKMTAAAQEQVQAEAMTPVLDQGDIPDAEAEEQPIAPPPIE
jgi:hypothetical protein